MVGISDTDGKWLDGWAHTVQSLRVIFTTPIGSRVMRRVFGSLIPAFLGRSMSLPLLLRLKTAIIVAVELWEPRFSISIVYDEGADTIADLRGGKLSLSISGVYRPRGHLGDFTSDSSTKTVTMDATSRSVTLS